jgi:hypothetical protein
MIRRQAVLKQCLPPDHPNAGNTVHPVLLIFAMLTKMNLGQKSFGDVLQKTDKIYLISLLQHL